MKMLSLLLVAAGLTACTAPPSVSPLLRAAQRAMDDEKAHLQADAQRDAQHVEQARLSLAAAFDADLRQRGQLDAAWVSEAAEVYAAAREALARHDAALRHERQQRADNLQLAADAITRARILIERQDALITGALGADLWSWLRLDHSAN